MADSGTAPNSLESVLSSGESPRKSAASPASLTAKTRLINSRPGSRGSRARTTSPARGARKLNERHSTTSRSPGRSDGAIELPCTSTTSSHRLAGTPAPIPAAVPSNATIGRRRFISVNRNGSGRSPVQARLAQAAGPLPHLVDAVDQAQQLLGCLEIGALLDLGGGLRRLPADVVQVRVLLHVLRLEVVVPHDVDVVLRLLGARLIDDDAALPEVLIGAGVVLLDDPVARFSLDARLLGVVDPARNVAVGVDAPRGAQDGTQGQHGIPPVPIGFWLGAQSSEGVARTPSSCRRRRRAPGR